MVTGRSLIFCRISSALCPRTTIIFPTSVDFNAETIFSTNRTPSMGNRAFGRPMRLDSPAERMTGTIMLGSNSLLVHLVNKTALFELPDNAFINQIFNSQARSGLTSEGFLNLHFGTLSCPQLDSTV